MDPSTNQLMRNTMSMFQPIAEYEVVTLALMMN